MGLLLVVGPFIGLLYGLLSFYGVSLWTLVSLAAFIVLTVRAFRIGWRGRALQPFAAQIVITIAMVIVAYKLDGDHSWRPSQEEFQQTLSIFTWAAVATWAWLIGLNIKKPAGK